MNYGIGHAKADKTIITKISDKKVLIKRYYLNGQLKYKAYLNEMPNELRSKTDGTQITLKDYSTRAGSKADGIASWWHSNGQLFKSVNYLDGRENGHLEIFHQNSQCMEKGKFVKGRKIGPWEYFNKEGKLRNHVSY